MKNASASSELTRYFPDFPLPVLAVVARSGSGKTTLLSKLIPLLKQAGLGVAVIKHSHHDVEIDQPGKDSHRLREAGAGQVMLASPHRSFWIAEGDGEQEPRLQGLLHRLDVSSLDLVLLEGYRHESVAKLEVYRSDVSGDPLCIEDSQVIAVASDAPLDASLQANARGMDIPVFEINNLSAVGDFVLQLMRS